MGSEYILRVMLTTFLLAVGKFPNTVSLGLMHWALHTIQTWCGETDETELVVFTSKRKLPAFFGSLSFGVTLHHYKSVKYLGVVLEGACANQSEGSDSIVGL